MVSRERSGRLVFPAWLSESFLLAALPECLSQTPELSFCSLLSLIFYFLFYFIVTGRERGQQRGAEGEGERESLFLLNVYLLFWERAREHKHGEGGGERWRHRFWRWLRLWAVSPTRGSNSPAVRSWPEPKSDAQPTEPPRRPSDMYIIYQF